MQQPMNDSLISQTLAEIVQTLTMVQNTLKLNSRLHINMSEDLKTAAATLNAKLKLLEAELGNYSSNAFSYEFYDSTTDAVEQISQLRLASETKKPLQLAGLFTFFNELVKLLRSAVHQHPAFAGARVNELTPPAQTLDAAKTKVTLATERASQASALAEKANADGMKNLQAMKKEQLEQDGLVSPDLLDSSINHTLAMLALNAGAVLAADEAAMAIVEMEDLIDKLSAE